MYQIRLCYSHKIRYIIIWHVLSSLIIYTYGQSGYRQYWSLIPGAPGDTDWDDLEIHLEAVIGGTGRYTLMPRLSEFGDALGGRDRVELRDAVVGRDHAGLEIYF
jgi:hypothetical protein